jgi:zinc transporter, ZIP family
MNQFLTVLALAMLPALGNFVGGLVSEAVTVSQRTLSLALHIAAGIVMAVVGLELIPEALDVGQPWIPLLAFVAGSIGFILLERAIGWVQGRFAGVQAGADPETPAQQEDEAANAGPWAIYAGVAIDLFSDGVMIGTGSNIALGLGLLLALGQVPADIPEGFATIATFKEQGIPRARRVLLAASLAIPILLGATLGFFGVRGGPEIVKLSLLAFTAGILVSVAIEEMIPEAHEAGDPRFAPLALVGGFALFALISVYFE